MADRVVPNKVKLLPDDKLTSVLKTHLFDTADPFDYSMSTDESGSTPKDTFVFSPDVTEDESSGEDGLAGDTVVKYGAPNLEDIVLVKSEIYYDQKKVPHARFIFNVKNHIGDEVVGAYGIGG